MIIGNYGNGSLGDCLYITSAFRYIDGKVILHNDEQSKQVGLIFNNICEVEYSDNPPERPDNIIKDFPSNFFEVHRSRKILLSLGIQNSISVPFIKLTKEEVEWAKQFLNKYKNPIVIVNDNSGNWDKTNIRANYVRPPIKLIEEICNNFISNNYTPLQFGRKEDNKFTPLNNSIQIRGLSIREIAACYSIIKKYIGGDTGDYHLMLAAGGFANVLIPDESKDLGYIYNDLLYKPENFENNVSRVNYINYNQFV